MRMSRRDSQTNGRRSIVLHAEVLMKPLIIVMLLGLPHLVTPVSTNEIRKIGYTSSAHKLIALLFNVGYTGTVHSVSRIGSSTQLTLSDSQNCGLQNTEDIKGTEKKGRMGVDDQ
jgi:hypothetical protein